MLLAHPDQLENQAGGDATRAFLSATAEGYRRAAADPAKAAAALCACGRASLGLRTLRTQAATLRIQAVTLRT